MSTEPSSWTTPFAFLGNPVVALVIGAILAVYVLLPALDPAQQGPGAGWPTLPHRPVSSC
ncbi:hypothetical protein LP422_22990 [Janibacter limosus]|uniref:hypothetical protein n=1 Tax=Janibacter limosus TaxID=53458 RepID=UPI0035D9D181|nr:hypothetical protein LP422_22990 [Janibacter limosus]